MRGFKVSRDPKFVEKLEDIVDLYMPPSEHVLVLCWSDPTINLLTPRMEVHGLSSPAAHVGR